MSTQLAEATRRGVEVRTQRAQVKREIKAGEARISEILIETAGGVPTWLENFGIAEFLDAMHGVSFKMGEGLCESLGIPPLKPVGKMTYRQRVEVARHLAEWEETAVPSGGKRAVLGRIPTKHRWVGRAA